MLNRLSFPKTVALYFLVAIITLTLTETVLSRGTPPKPLTLDQQLEQYEQFCLTYKGSVFFGRADHLFCPVCGAAFENQANPAHRHYMHAPLTPTLEGFLKWRKENR